MVSVLGILPSFSACGAERGRPSITFLCVQVSSRRQLCGLLSGGTRPAPFTPPLKQNDLFACLLARRVGPSATPSVRVWSCVRRSGGSFVILPLSLSLALWLFLHVSLHVHVGLDAWAEVGCHTFMALFSAQRHRPSDLCATRLS